MAGMHILSKDVNRVRIKNLGKKKLRKSVPRTTLRRHPLNTLTETITASTAHSFWNPLTH